MFISWLGARRLLFREVATGCALLALLMGASVHLGAEPSATPRLDWFFDGYTTSTVRIGNVIYVGGGFRHVLPASGVLGYLVALSPTTGVADPTFAPANSPVYGAEPDGNGGYFISKTTSANATSTSTAVIVHARSDGSLDPTFSSAAITGVVTQLVRVGPSLVIAGGSNSNGLITAGGVDRPLAALDPASGAVSPWSPVLPGSAPRVVDMAAANGRLFVLSKPALFSDGRHVSAFDAATGALLWGVQVVAETTQYPFESGGALAVAGTRLVVGTDVSMQSFDAASGALDPTWGGPLTGAKVLEVAVSATAVFVRGQFTTFMGAARSNLAALNLATGALTSWNPPQSIQAFAMAVSASGSLFVPLQRAGAGGTTTTSIVELDSTGSPTAWTSSTVGGVLGVSPSGALLVATGSLAGGGTPRTGLAAFDALTGALLPEAPLLTDFDVSGLVAQGQTLFISGSFSAVNGVPRQFGAAVDTTTNTTLPWTLPGAEQVVLAHAGYIYTAVNDFSGGAQTWRLRRRDATTGAQDQAWQPPLVFDVVPEGNSLVAALPRAGVAVGVLDATSGQFAEAFRTTALATMTEANFSVAFGGRLALDGDTVYLSGRLPGQNAITGRDLADAVLAFDRKSGVQVSPGLRGYINGVTVADGRVIPFGGRLALKGTERVEIAEVAGPGGFTSWIPGWPWRDAPVFFGAMPGADFTRGVTRTSVAGDLLLVRGLATGLYGTDRLAGYPLTGPSVPSALRAQSAGADTVFSWAPMTPHPSGGYLIEGGFGAGQTAGALAVGNATSVALPMPAGPAYIRVRAQGSTDTSNEVVAGCLAPPLPPTALTATLSGINLMLTWTAPSGPVTGYTLLAGTASGLSNVATLALGPQPSVAGPVSGGTFFARVTASNACGTSAPSGEVFFTIGAPDALPASPTGLASSATGSTLTLTWTAPGGPVTGYVLEAGSALGLANIGAATLGATTSFVIPGVPAGTYYVRVRAITSAGSGAPSSDVVVVVP